MLVFQEAQLLLGFTGLLIQSVSPDAVPCSLIPLTASQGKAVQGTSEDPDSGPGSAPAGGGPWPGAFAPGLPFSYPLSTGVVTFPVISCSLGVLFRLMSCP